MESTCLNCKEMPKVRCYCKENEQLFCLNCLGNHLTINGVRHVVKEIQEKKSPICGCKRLADMLCICQDEKTLLCHFCLVAHMTNNPTTPHSIEPLIVDSLTEESSDLKRFIEKKKIVEKLIQEARKNLETVSKFEESVKKAREKILKVLDETIEKCSEKAAKARENIEKLINDLESKKFLRGEDELLKRCTFENLSMISKDFKYLLSQVKDDQVCSLISSFADLKVIKDPFKAIPAIYYVNSKTQEVSFSDAQSLQFNKVQMPASLNLKDHGVWCEIATGCLFYCGGQRQSVCSAECFEIDIVENSYKPLASMNEARCFSAIIKKSNFIYVFGGYQGKISLKSAEKFDIVNNRWTELHEMANPRSCFTACLMENQILLCGDNKTIEFFDTITEEYGLFSLKLPFYLSHSISFSINRKVIIFQKDKLSEGNTDMNEAKIVKTIPTGNWWSQFSPILYDKKIYFARCDENSLWSFDSEKYDLKKILKF